LWARAPKNASPKPRATHTGGEKGGTAREEARESREGSAGGGGESVPASPGGAAG